MITHSNGASRLLEYSGTTVDPYDVLGAMGSSIFAVGRGGTILHDNGSGWEPMTSPATTDLFGVGGLLALGRVRRER